ncbi:MAG: energy transducer TonB [Terriglobales bacterium]
MFNASRSRWVVAAMLAVTLLHAGLGLAETERKLKSKVDPVYPELAKQMRVVGTVKIEVVIAENGTIHSAKVLGGHPLLIQSVTDALKKWRYEPGPESTRTIEFHFQHE